mmetsp:Transcript_86527/g.220495  ORF Transcript_86527/g.220495 Transcript_86527/m.220495 type:complete len:276 (+) Transcript_86527:3-830(+)
MPHCRSDPLMESQAVPELTRAFAHARLPSAGAGLRAASFTATILESLGGAGVDARNHGVRVDQTVLDLVEDHAGHLDKYFLDALPGERARFQEKDVVFLGTSARLQEGDNALILDVALVSYGDDGDVCPGQRPSIRKPIDEVVVRVSVGDVVDDQGTGSAAVIAPRDRPIPFLPGGVPNLEFDAPATDLDDFGTELHTDGVGGALLEFILDELMEQTGLSSTSIANNNELEEVIVLILLRSHAALLTFATSTPSTTAPTGAGHAWGGADLSHLNT